MKLTQVIDVGCDTKCPSYAIAGVDKNQVRMCLSSNCFSIGDALQVRITRWTVTVHTNRLDREKSVNRMLVPREPETWISFGNKKNRTCLNPRPPPLPANKNYQEHSAPVFFVLNIAVASGRKFILNYAERKMGNDIEHSNTYSIYKSNVYHSCFIYCSFCRPIR
jgi:hypothetical protein